MGARILHFGLDESNRVPVLRSAGYVVEACPSLPNLDSALHHDGEPAAVVMSDSHASESHAVLNMVHSSSFAPVILFERTTYCPDERDFDLVIPNLTPVKEWLAKIAATIERPRAFHPSEREIRQQSE